MDIHWTCSSEFLTPSSTDKINEEATAHPGKAYNQKTLKLYAVRANAEQMLDVARGTFKENVDDIHKRKYDRGNLRMSLTK
jgi:hypothetical protein